MKFACRQSSNRYETYQTGFQFEGLGPSLLVGLRELVHDLFRVFRSRGTFLKKANDYYGKCSKISNTLKLRTPKIIAENNFKNILKNRTLPCFGKVNF